MGLPAHARVQVGAPVRLLSLLLFLHWDLLHFDSATTQRLGKGTISAERWQILVPIKTIPMFYWSIPESIQAKRVQRTK